ncbi:MAG: Nif11-like leader peptide family natural product precursor [Oscillospiraceae bacterium]|nr:Nif11-like leader peptide family natural product precursor [Oscillospiraceae bacterium]
MKNEFFKRLSEDKEFEATYKKFETIEAVLEQVEKDGYSISEEVESLRSQAEFNQTGRVELDDAMLENIGGGFLFPQSLLDWFVSLFRYSGIGASGQSSLVNSETSAPAVKTLEKNSAVQPTVLPLPNVTGTPTPTTLPFNPAGGKSNKSINL